MLPILWRFIPPSAPKQSATSSPVSQRNYRCTLCQAEDVIPALSCLGRGQAFQYEFWYPLCDPSVLGSHKYSNIVQSSLKSITLQTGSCSSFLSPKELSDLLNLTNVDSDFLVLNKEILDMCPLLQVASECFRL